MLPPFSRGGMVRRHWSVWLPFGPQTAGRQRADRLRRQCDAARLAELALALEPGLDLGVARQHADRAHERRDRHPDARHLAEVAAWRSSCQLTM